MYVSSSTSKQGGAELCMLKLAQHFGQDSVGVLPERAGIAFDYIKSDIPVVFVPMKRMRRSRSLTYQAKYMTSVIRAIPHLAMLIHQYQIDLVHVNEFIDFHALMAAKLLRIPTVCHIRTIVERPLLFKYVMVALVRCFSDRIVCVSNAVKTSMFGERMSNGRQIGVVYDGGPDLERFDPSLYDRVGTRRSIGLDERDYVVGLISKFVQVKGHMHLIEAAKRIRETVGDSFRYLLIGGPVDGHEAYLDQVKTSIRDNGLTRSFVLAGYRSDVPALLSACDVVVHLPLYQDPFPGVVLEAMAMEKPVIVYRSGGTVEQLKDGASGLLVAQGDLDGLADLIIQLSRDVALRQRIGKNARRYAQSSFSLEKHFAEIEVVYGLALGAGRH
jgi:glycosyltransferase involved in cell wall biosynthesis